MKQLQTWAWKVTWRKGWKVRYSGHQLPSKGQPLCTTCQYPCVGIHWTKSARFQHWAMERTSMLPSCGVSFKPFAWAHLQPSISANHFRYLKHGCLSYSWMGFAMNYSRKCIMVSSWSLLADGFYLELKGETSWAGLFTIITVELVDQLSHSFGMHIKTLYCACSQSFTLSFLISGGERELNFGYILGMGFTDSYLDVLILGECWDLNHPHHGLLC